MAQGYLGLGASLSFPGEEAREKYAADRARGKKVYGTPNPLFEGILGQLLTNLDPRVQRQRTRRQFGRYSDAVVRGTQDAMNNLQASYARRGLGGSGIAARAQGGLAQEQAFQRAQLPGLYQEALSQQQTAARNEALRFLLSILAERRGATQANESIEARKTQGRLARQQILESNVGMIGGGVGSILGGLLGGGA